jgi:hypothetical protein
MRCFIFALLARYWVDNINKNNVRWACGMRKGDEKCLQNFSWKILTAKTIWEVEMSLMFIFVTKISTKVDISLCVIITYEWEGSIETDDKKLVEGCGPDWSGSGRVSVLGYWVHGTYLMFRKRREISWPTVRLWRTLKLVTKIDFRNDT